MIENGRNRLDMVKCVVNLVLDRKVGFSQKKVSHEISLFNRAQPHVISGRLHICASYLYFDLISVVGMLK